MTEKKCTNSQQILHTSSWFKFLGILDSYLKLKYDDFIGRYLLYLHV